MSDHINTDSIKEEINEFTANELTTIKDLILSLENFLNKRVTFDVESESESEQEEDTESEFEGDDTETKVVDIKHEEHGDVIIDSYSIDNPNEDNQPPIVTHIFTKNISL